MSDDMLYETITRVLLARRRRNSNLGVVLARVHRVVGNQWSDEAIRHALSNPRDPIVRAWRDSGAYWVHASRIPTPVAAFDAKPKPVRVCTVSPERIEVNRARSRQHRDQLHALHLQAWENRAYADLVRPQMLPSNRSLGSRGWAGGLNRLVQAGKVGYKTDGPFVFYFRCDQPPPQPVARTPRALDTTITRLIDRLMTGDRADLEAHIEAFEAGLTRLRAELAYRKTILTF